MPPSAAGSADRDHRDREGDKQHLQQTHDARRATLELARQQVHADRHEQQRVGRPDDDGETGEQLADAGVDVDYGQELVFSTEVGGIGEVIGIGVATVVLLVMLGSLVMAGMPLAVAFTGVGASLLGALALTHWLDLQQMAPVLGAMLGLAVGIDYALFIVNRHRRQLADLVRQVLLLVRAVLDHVLGRLETPPGERRAAEPVVEDIPLD